MKYKVEIDCSEDGVFDIPKGSLVVSVERPSPHIEEVAKDSYKVTALPWVITYLSPVKEEC